jgi:hypothetical protein
MDPARITRAHRKGKSLRQFRTHCEASSDKRDMAQARKEVHTKCIVETLPMSLKSKLIAQTSAIFTVMVILLFLPAGTLNFWEAWVFVVILFIPMVIFSIYFLIHDPAVVQRRMQQREKIKAQKWIMGIATVVSLTGMVVPGLDHRFSWSHQLAGGVPLWLKICAQVIMFVAYLTTM